MCAIKEAIMHVCTETNRLERIESDIKEIKQAVQDIDKKLFKGNGTPSLMSRVTVLETKFDNLDASGTNRINIWIMVGTVIGALAAWIPYIIK